MRRDPVPTMMRLALAWFACAGGCALGAETAELLEDATKIYRQAAEIGLEDQAHARDLYLQAAGQFQAAIDAGQVDPGRAYYNLGTAYYHGGDLGRAILNYRRAERFLPDNVTLQSNLDAARRRRLDYVEEEPPRHAFQTLLFWHYDLTAETRADLFVIAYLVLWVCAVARLFRNYEEIRWGLGLAAVASVALAISLAVGSDQHPDSDAAVVIVAQTMPHSEPSLSSQPAFVSPLHSGTELRVVGLEEDWCRVVLPDGRSGWIPQEGIERVVSEG